MISGSAAQNSWVRNRNTNSLTEPCDSFCMSAVRYLTLTGRCCRLDRLNQCIITERKYIITQLTQNFINYVSVQIMEIIKHFCVLQNKVVHTMMMMMINSIQSVIKYQLFYLHTLIKTQEVLVLRVIQDCLTLTTPNNKNETIKKI